MSAVRALLTPRAAVLPVLWAFFLLAFLLVVVGQRLLVSTAPLGVALLCWGAGLAALVVMERRADSIARDASVATPHDTERLGVAEWCLIALAAGCALALWFLATGRPEDADYLDIALLWLLSMAAAFLAAAWPLRGQSNRSRVVGIVLKAGRGDWLLVAVVAVIAVVLRTVMLDRFPSILDHDGMSLAMVAVDVLDGRVTNPFTTGWYDNPTLFAYLQAGSVWLFGRSVSGASVPSALFGAGGIVLTWLLARRLFGRSTAAIAAVVLAVFHYHLHFSRSALNIIADSFFLLALLYCLDRGLVEQRRVYCLLAGLSIGFGQYFYFSSRMLPVIAAAYGLFFLVPFARRALAPRPARQAAILVAWVVGGALLAFLPLLAHYADQPEDFESVFNRTPSVFTSGWLEQQRESTGMSSAEVLARQAQKGLLLPFQTEVTVSYNPSAPFIGMPMAVLTAVGLAIATAGVRQRRYMLLAIAWWITLAAVGTTENVSTQRFVLVAPLIAIFCAIALNAAWRIGTSLLGLDRTVATAVVAGAVVFLVVWNLQFYFRESNRLDDYGDVNSLVATRLAYYLRENGPYTVYFGGPPRMWYLGFSGIPFLARDSRGIDLKQPLYSRRAVPSLHRRTLFVFLPERARELQFVRARYPDGKLQRFSDPKAGPLFTTYEVLPTADPAHTRST